MVRKRGISTGKTTSKNYNIEHKLIENLVELQKIHTELAVKFDKLTQEISTLLKIFEGAAKQFGEQVSLTGDEKDKQFLEKIDKLLDQNKLIAKGLTLVEERMRERMYSSQQQMARDEPFQQSPQQQNKPLPRF
jgi:hypothetical protein